MRDLLFDWPKDLNGPSGDKVGLRLVQAVLIGKLLLLCLRCEALNVTQRDSKKGTMKGRYCHKIIYFWFQADFHNVWDEVKSAPCQITHCDHRGTLQRWVLLLPSIATHTRIVANLVGDNFLPINLLKSFFVGNQFTSDHIWLRQPARAAFETESATLLPEAMSRVCV